MSPESMERMGVVRIFKEAARLFYHHFRLFLPFFLAFHLPASFLTVFYTVFLTPQNAYTNVLNSAYTTGHGDTDNVLPSIILSFVVVAPMVVLSILGAMAFTYIVDYIYSDLSDDDAIIRRVFKLLPHAFLRVLVTLLWEYVVLLLFAVACGLLGFVLLALYFLVSGVGDPSPSVFLVVFGLPQVAGLIVLVVVFANAQSIAVLEQENYGRNALKQSRRYARGRAWTIFSVVALGSVVATSINSHARAVATAGLSLATEVLAASVMSVVFSFCTAYVALVVIVTYFVCKSGSDVAALPVANPYRPVATGSTQIGEP